VISDFIEKRLSLNYFIIETTNQTISIESIDSPDDYGLLLPRKKNPNVEDENDKKAVYTIITRSWKEISEKKVFVLA